MAQLTFITGSQGTGKTLLAQILQNNYAAKGVPSVIASYVPGIGDWSTPQEIEALRKLPTTIVLVDCLLELPKAVAKEGEVHIHIEVAQ